MVPALRALLPPGMPHAVAETVPHIRHRQKVPLLPAPRRHGGTHKRVCVRVFVRLGVGGG